MSEPRWITSQELYLIHVRQIELFGGRHGVIDDNVIESALNKPRNLHAYESDSDIAAYAAAYLCGFAQKQGFADGNKRTALAVALTFLRLNSHQLNVPKAELFAFVIAISTNEMNQEAATKWLRERISSS